MKAELKRKRFATTAKQSTIARIAEIAEERGISPGAVLDEAFPAKEAE